METYITDNIKYEECYVSDENLLKPKQEILDTDSVYPTDCSGYKTEIDNIKCENMDEEHHSNQEEYFDINLKTFVPDTVDPGKNVIHKSESVCSNKCEHYIKEECFDQKPEAIDTDTMDPCSSLLYKSSSDEGTKCEVMPEGYFVKEECLNFNQEVINPTDISSPTTKLDTITNEEAYIIEYYSCSACDFSSGLMLDVDNHMNIHTAKILYCCTICDYSTKANLH